MSTKISNTKRKLAIAIGKKTVEHLCSVFGNSVNRGPNFKWSEFPKMCYEMASMNFWMTQSDYVSKNIIREGRLISARTARYYAKQHLLGLK